MQTNNQEHKSIEPEYSQDIALILKKPWEAIDAAALAKMDEPATYALIAKGCSDELSYADFRIWTSAVSAGVKKIRTERAAELRAKKEERGLALLKRAKKLDLPVFEVGDHAELARKLCMELMEGREELLAYDFGYLHRYKADIGLWEAITDEQCSNVIQGWSGAPIVSAFGEGMLKVNNVKTPVELATHKPSSWGRGEGWLAKAPKGIAFSDGFMAVNEFGPCPVLEPREHSPENKARVGFEFPFDPDAECPRFHSYLNDIWGGADDFDQRVKLVQEFVGVALTGMGPRYKRALILFGAKGTGKSTFLKMIRGMFPPTAVSEVSPLDWSDDNKIAALGSSRLNTVFELTADHLRNQERVKEVIDGERIQIREVYRRQTTIWPLGAHLFATNKLFRAPGADPSFWDRWLVLDLFSDRSWRGKKGEGGEIRDLAEQILREELPGLVTWALNGARRAFEQDGFTVPDVCNTVMKTWMEEADVVGLWLAADTEVTATNTGNFTSATELYKRFKVWAEDNNHGRLSSHKFWMRLRDRGIDNKKSNGSKYDITMSSGSIFMR